MAKNQPKLRPFRGVLWVSGLLRSSRIECFKSKQTAQGQPRRTRALLKPLAPEYKSKRPGPEETASAKLSKRVLSYTNWLWSNRQSTSSLVPVNAAPARLLQGSFELSGGTLLSAFPSEPRPARPLVVPSSPETATAVRLDDDVCSDEEESRAGSEGALLHESGVKRPESLAPFRSLFLRLRPLSLFNWREFRQSSSRSGKSSSALGNSAL